MTEPAGVAGGGATETTEHALHGTAHFAGPLLRFGEALGIDRSLWARAEEVHRLSLTVDRVPAAAIAALRPEHVLDLAHAYGEALTCRFLLGDLVELDVTPGLDPDSVAEFQARVARDGAALRLDVRLDKQDFARNRLATPPHCRIVPYLSVEAAERFVQGPLSRLEHELWGEATARKVVLLVPAEGVRLDGSFLAVFGGEHQSDWRDAVPGEAPSARLVEAIREGRRQRLKWDGPRLVHLTPLHLRLSGAAPEGDRITAALRVHAANAAILYTADRTAEAPDGRLMATYASPNRRAEVALGDPTELVGGDPGPLIDLVEWAYAPERWADRLPLVQFTVIEQVDSAEDPRERFRVLVASSAQVLKELQWNWKAFLGQKLDGYLTQVKDLETYVDDTVQAYSDQLNLLVKGLQDAALAAVGVTVGSFVAALFKDPFNAAVFAAGLLLYAVYLGMFPFAFGMLAARTRYLTVSTEWALRIERFRRRLYSEKLDEIVGTRIEQSKVRVRRWGYAACIAYVALLALSVGAALAALGAPPGQGIGGSAAISTPTVPAASAPGGGTPKPDLELVPAETGTRPFVSGPAP